jgi:hypothetical protein
VVQRDYTQDMYLKIELIGFTKGLDLPCEREVSERKLLNFAD